MYCKDGKCYIAVEKQNLEKRTFLEAQRCCTCNGINANLATFDNQEQADEVYDNLSLHFLENGMATMWIGAYSRSWDIKTGINYEQQFIICDIFLFENFTGIEIGRFFSGTYPMACSKPFYKSRSNTLYNIYSTIKVIFNMEHVKLD